MQKQILDMMQLQDEMNKKVNPDWISRGNEWYRAIWIECAELMDHHGWKWWKHQEPDIEQIKLELIDIWHFGLSIILLEQSEDDDTTSTQVAEQIAAPMQFESLLSGVEVFAENTLATKSFSVAMFAGLMQLIELSLDDLYKTYVGKHVLNMFRQDHGYKTGSYLKQWDGREDNEHLVEAVGAMDSNNPQFKDRLYAELKQRYDLVVA